MILFLIFLLITLAGVCVNLYIVYHIMASHHKTIFDIALCLTCLVYAVSWPVKSFMYLDLLNIYLDIIRWKDLINQELSSIMELKVVCSTLLEWRWPVMVMQFNIFFGCFLFRYFLIKFADRGLLLKGVPNIGLFNALFWIHNIFVTLSTVSNFPFTLKLKPGFPFNNMMGKICSGYGVHHSKLTQKQESLHIMLLAVALVYLANICYISVRTSRFVSKISPKGSGALFNKNYRRNFLSFGDTRSILLAFLALSMGRWGMFRIFLYTDWFNGQQQFVVQHTNFFVVDMYLTMYFPYSWITKSVQNNWAGWAQIKRKRTYFYFVRKPNPMEDLQRQGYFQKCGQFAYFRRKSNMVKDAPQLRVKPEDCTYVIREPEGGIDVSMSASNEWVLDIEEI